jgi:hypothetical protein
MASPPPSVGGIATAAAHPHGHGPPQWVLTVGYGLTNLLSVVMIVVANKMVLFTLKFHFVVTLTFLHSVFTAVGMGTMAAAGLFQVKQISPRHSIPIASVYVGFIIFNNLSIQVNPLGAHGRDACAHASAWLGGRCMAHVRAACACRAERWRHARSRAQTPPAQANTPHRALPPGFYQLSKLAITPVVVVIEYFAYGKTVSKRVLASIAVLLVGITLCTVTDAEVKSNVKGIAAAAASVLVASLYQVRL